MTESILIVSYNTRADVEACVDRLLSTGAPERAIYVADNGSTDGTPERIRRLFPHITLLQFGTNRGYAEATNQLVRVARGDLLLLLNPDVDAGYRDLRECTARFDKDPRLAAVAPQLRNPGGTIQPSCRRIPDRWTPVRELVSSLTRRPSAWKMGDFDHATPRDVEQPMFSCIWIRRKAWERVGPLDIGYPLFFNDVDWCARARRAGFRIFFDPSVAVIHRRGGTTRHYPWRKLWYSHAAFARFLWRTAPWSPSILPGLALLGLGWAVRVPGLLLRTGLSE